MSTDPTGLGAISGTAEGEPPGDAAHVRQEPAVDVGPSTDRVPVAKQPAPRRGQRSAPPASAGRRARRRRKVRRVHRVVRHVEVWSVAKVTAAFVACAYVIGLISGYLLWRAADRVGTIDGIEGFFEDAGGYDRFELVGGVVFRSAAVIGLVVGALTVFLVVLAAVLFNLISDLTGGIRMTVIDEDLVVTPVPRPGPAPVPDVDRGNGRQPAPEPSGAPEDRERPA